jgi:predicted Fe-Mo cluster-binding NifX family protein
MVYNSGAQVLMTGYCGPKAFQTLQQASIKVVSDVSGTVSQAVEKFKSEEFHYLEAPNAQAHW